MTNADVIDYMTRTVRTTERLGESAIKLPTRDVKVMLARLAKLEAVAEAAEIALLRIESDIESDTLKTSEGGLLRSTLAALNS